MKSYPPINNLGYCEQTRNVDDMLFRFKLDREKILYLLLTDYTKLISIIWSDNSPISIDRNCLYNMGYRNYNSLEEHLNGTNIFNDTISSFYMCSQCRNMGRIVNISSSKINNIVYSPFYIECGQLAGKVVILTKMSANVVFSEITQIQRSKLSSIIKDNTSISICDPKIIDYNSLIDYIGSDPFTNQILITWYLDSELSKVNLPHICKMYTAFICNEDGYCLYENPDIGNIKKFQQLPNLLNMNDEIIINENKYRPIRSDIASQIIKQLFVTFSYLSKYDFSYGEPNSNCLVFFNEPCSYNYNNIHVDSPITLKLYDLCNSGIKITTSTSTSSTIRLYCKSIIADEQIKRIPGKFLINIMSITLPTDDINNLETVVVYRLNNISNNLNESILYMYLKHLGIPLYQSSFDIYAFMVILMSEITFYSAVINDANLYKLWKSLWLPQEFINVMEKLKLFHTEHDSTSNFYKVLQFLSNFHLKCNILSLCLSQIQSWK